VQKVLTARQIEALRHIYDFLTKNGFPPTISDLRKAMGVASDQGVIELLQRLEDRGMIDKRTAGQARSVKLTSEALLAIGVPSIQPGGSSVFGANAAVFELGPIQQRIHKRLSDIDPKLARMYEGGLRVLIDATNPERVALSAHSIRESTYHLSNLGKNLLTKEQTKDASEAKASNARQLERLFDPQGGTRHFDRTVYDLWNREFHNFFVEVSHHGREVTVEEYCEKLAEYEEFLDRYILPLQTKIYALLDEQLSGGPGRATAEDLKFLLSRNVESYSYFFRKADIRWLHFLDANKLLSPAWETTDYLVRISTDAAEKVMAIVERMQTPKEDWAARRGLIEAATKMPPLTARRLIAKIEQEKWLAEPYADWLAHNLTDLAGRFIRNGQHDDAIRLATLMFAGTHGPEPDLKGYHQQQLLKQFSSVPAAELQPYVAFLAETLKAVMAADGREEYDYSLIWRPAIEDHEQNDHHGDTKYHLVTSLRDALSRYTDELAASGDQTPWEILDRLLGTEKADSIFSRIRLYIYRKHADLFLPAIEDAVLKEFDCTNAWHEYYLLLKEQFPHLKKSTRSRWFALLDDGPDGEHDDTYIRHWRARKLSAVVAHLTRAERKRYQQLIHSALEINHPDFLSHGGGMWIGPTSPLTEETLTGMSIDDLLRHLASWTPSSDWLSPSREGLGRVLSELVKKQPEAFSREAHRFANPDIRPVYIYHLFFGLRDAPRNKISLNWKSILTLALALVEQAQSGTLPTFVSQNRHDAWGSKWDGAFQEIASLLEAGLENPAVGPSFELREDIWRVLCFVCEHPEPTPEYEQQYGGNNMEPLTLSINTVRGRGFHALFAYLFWCDRHFASKGENGSRIPAECKAVLEAHLDPMHDPSLTVRSVYGRFFPWLYIYEPAWATGLLDRLFPLKAQELRYAAWETYLLNAVFPQVYGALKPLYELAISETRKFTRDRRFSIDPVQRLAEHMMVAYAYRAEPDKSATWAKFFRVATAKDRGSAVSFGGRAYILRDSESFDETSPDISRLQEFWEWRLADSKDAEELREFGWWVKEGKFSDEWMLQRLIGTLKKTEGAIEADNFVLDALADLASPHPLLCGQALMLIVKSRHTERWILGPGSRIQDILTTLYSKPAAEERHLAVQIIDYLTKLGFEAYRQILENPPSALDSNLPERESTGL
jgi:hypothetical protein